MACPAGNGEDPRKSSFITAIADLITGGIALNQKRADGRGGRGFAIAGLVLNGILFLAGMWFFTLWAVGDITA